MNKSRRFFARNLFSMMISLIVVSTLFSCGDLFTDNTKITPSGGGSSTGNAERIVTLTGIIRSSIENGAIPSEYARLVASDDSRAALPLASYTDTEYYLRATAQDVTDEVPGTVDAENKTFSIPLSLGHVWTLELVMKKRETSDADYVPVLYATHNFEDKLSESDVSSPLTLVLMPQQAETGKINLQFTAPSDGYQYDSVSVELYDSTEVANWSGVSVTQSNISANSIKSGKYTVTFNFFRTSGELVYSTTQAINVFDNMTTDRWADSGSQYSPINNDDRTFTVTRELIRHFYGTTFCVSASGNNNNSGSFYEPLKTVGEALSRIAQVGTGSEAYTVLILNNLTENVTLESELNGKASSITIKSAPGVSATIDGYHNGSVFDIATTVPVSLEKLTIKNGSANLGGGVHTDENTNVTMKNCTVTNNTSTAYGGGIYNLGSLSLTNTEITYNSSASANSAGGVFNDGGGTTSISGKVIIKNNTADSATSNLYLPAGKTVTVAGALSEESDIGIKTQTTPGYGHPVQITSGFGTYNSVITPSKIFTSDIGEGYLVIASGSGTNVEAAIDVYGGEINDMFSDDISVALSCANKEIASGSVLTVTANVTKNGNAVTLAADDITWNFQILCYGYPVSTIPAFSVTPAAGCARVVIHPSVNIAGGVPYTIHAKATYDGITYGENFTLAGSDLGFVSVPGATISSTINGSAVFNGRTLTIPNMYVSNHEVTKSEYAAVMGGNGSGEESVKEVSWFDALKYCNKKSIADGLTPCYAVDGKTNPDEWSYESPPSNLKGLHSNFIVGLITCNFGADGYRLPTEAEWEYTARGGNGLTGTNESDFMNASTNEWCWDYSKNLTPTNNTPATGVLWNSSDNTGRYPVLRSGVSSRTNHLDPGYRTVYAVFRVVRTAVNEPNHTVTYDTKGGTEIASQNVWYGYYLPKPATPSKALLNFGGWYSDADCTTPFDFSTPVTADITLYAKWNSDFVYVEGTYFNGSATVPNSAVFIEGREFAIQNMYVCDHEVTQAEYLAVMEANPSNFQGDTKPPATGETQANRPVEMVKWYDAINYCNALSSAENLTQCYTIIGDNVTCNFNANGYRLPTEAEWEYIARGGNLTNSGQTTYSGTNSESVLTDYAWYKGNDNSKTHEVKKKTANSLGIYDMSGNVWEWCWDWNSTVSASTAVTGASSGTAKILRGGSSFGAAEDCTVFKRSYVAPGTLGSGGYDYGFRVVRTAVNETTTHTVTYNTYGGTEIASQNVWDGYYLPKPATPSKALLNFGGWYSNADCTTLFDFSTPITGNTTLYAKWNSDFVYVEGTHFNGSATVGSGSSAASHVFIQGRELVIPDLYVCDHEVTQGEYVAYMGTNPSHFNGTTGYEPATGETQANRPVEMVSWYAALTYCNKRSIAEQLTPCYTISGITDAQWANLAYSEIPTSNNATWNAAICDFNANGYRLPTEAEWEYIARCSEGLTGPGYYYSGTNDTDEITNYAWHSGNSDGKTHEVKKKAANTLGLYDMTGNVWEWCWDWFWDWEASSTSISQSIGFSGAVSGTTRVLRGNSWHYSSGENTVIRPGFYNPCGIDGDYDVDNGANHGFRVVCTASYVFHDSVSMLPSGTDGTAGTTGSYALFGDFPQTIKANVTVDENKTLTMGGNTYYKGSDGNWYAKSLENAADTGYTYSDGTPVAQGGTYKYFKVEPIKWRVVTEDYNNNGKKLLLAENILTGNVKYYLNQSNRTISGKGTVYPNNYEYSTIRAYLNGSYKSGDTQDTTTYNGKGFLQSAFTSSAQSLIAETTFSNGTSKFPCDNTKDRIFILSQSEATNSDYEFASSTTSDSKRILATTDYAKANHAYQGNGSNGGYWWTRTPFDGDDIPRAVRYVFDNGTINDRVRVDFEHVENWGTYRGIGVVPALCLE